MIEALLGLIQYVYSFFSSYGVYIFLYYGVVLLALAILSVAIIAREAPKVAKGIDRQAILILIAILLCFFVIESSLVPPTQHMYDDEYIYDGIAKNIMYSHFGGTCNIYSSTGGCLSGLSGGAPTTFYYEPIGWPLLMASAFLVWQPSFQSSFNAEMVLALTSIAAVFYVAYMLFDDSMVALFSALGFAATPLFMSYSRTSVINVPALAFSMLSIAALLTYKRSRSGPAAFATCSIVAFTFTVKTEAIAILTPILIAAYILCGQSGKRTRMPTKRLAMYAAFALLLVAPQLVFLYTTYTTSTYNQFIGLPRFSLQILNQNIAPDLLFWFNEFQSVRVNNAYGIIWHAEYPVLYTVMAILGLVLMLARRMYRMVLLLAIWFCVVVGFYSSYYAGSVTYGLGINARFYVMAFPVICMPMAFFAASAYKRVSSAVGRKAGIKGHNSRLTRTRLLASVVIIIAILAEPALQFASIVTMQPQLQAQFAGERASEMFDISSSSGVPSNCFVITPQPQLWWMLNKSAIYVSDALNASTMADIYNMSGGCIFFDQGADCYLYEAPNTGYLDTPALCNAVLGNLTTTTVDSELYTKFGWQAYFALYKAATPGAR